MKKTDLEKTKDKTINQLEKDLVKKRKELILSDTKRKAGKEKNLKKAKLIRKDVAQILTIIKEKQIIEEKVNKKK